MVIRGTWSLILTCTQRRQQCFGRWGACSSCASAIGDPSILCVISPWLFTFWCSGNITGHSSLVSVYIASFHFLSSHDQFHCNIVRFNKHTPTHLDQSVSPLHNSNFHSTLFDPIRLLLKQWLYYKKVVRTLSAFGTSASTTHLVQDTMIMHTW